MQALERTVLGPGGRAAFRVARGDLLRIVDIEGQQVCDLVSFAVADAYERLGMYPSRAVARSWRLTKGHKLYSNLARPMWEIEDDTVGEHYSGGGFCNPQINKARYGVTDAPTCMDNFVAALAPYGLGAKDIDFDACFNVFMTVAYEPDGGWAIREPKSRAGDHIDLRALMDQIVAISNCPQLLNPVNAGRLKPLALEITRA